MKFFCTLLFTFLFHASIAQLQYNMGVDTTSGNNEAILEFVNEYMQRLVNEPDLEPEVFYVESEATKFGVPDRIMSLVGGRTLYKIAEKTVISIREFENHTRVQVLFSFSGEGYPFQVFGMGNYYVVVEGESLKLRVPAAVITEDWSTTRVRHVNYHFPTRHQFDRSAALELQEKIEKLENDWELDPVDVEYFFTDSPDEIEAVKGFEFNFYMARNLNASGFASVEDGYTFSWGWGERYFHEVVHLYLNKVFPDSPLLEGIAVFYGGSMGHPAEWHYSRLSEYLGINPEVSPSDAAFYYMDEITNPQSTIAAALCGYVYERDGVEGLKRLMEYTSMNELYESEFGLLTAQEKDSHIRKILIELSQS